MELDPARYRGAMIGWTDVPRHVLRSLSSRIRRIRALSMEIYTGLSRAIPAVGSPSARLADPSIEGLDPMWDRELDSPY